MQLRQYDAAIEHYSAAISLQPHNLDAFIKRSRAREAKGLLDDALRDTDKVRAVFLFSFPPRWADECHPGNGIGRFVPFGL